jgi:hypothetical protein
MARLRVWLMRDTGPRETHLARRPKEVAPGCTLAATRKQPLRVGSASAGSGAMLRTLVAPFPMPEEVQWLFPSLRR